MVEKLAKEYNYAFVPLQDKFDEMSSKYNEEIYLFDGVHPNIAGTTLIANEWVRAFNEQINTNK